MRIQSITKDNLQVTLSHRQNGLDCAHRMNNDCQSANHQLKMIVDWNSKSPTQLIDVLHKGSSHSTTSVERAFTDRGEFHTAHYRVNAHVYNEKTRPT